MNDSERTSKIRQRSIEYSNDDGRSVIDSLDLAVDRRITAFGLPLQRRHPEDFIQSSPKLSMDSLVYQGLVKIGPAVQVLPFRMASEMDAHVKTPKFVQPFNRWSLIEVLDLAVDRRIASVGSLARGGHIVAASSRSSPELSVHSPMYGAVNTVPPVSRRLAVFLWRRSRRFDWRCIVNASRIICFCQSFIDLE